MLISEPLDVLVSTSNVEGALRLSFYRTATVFGGLSSLTMTKPSKVTGLCIGNPPITSELSVQRLSNSESVSMSWRHHSVHHARASDSNDAEYERGHHVRYSQYIRCMHGYPDCKVHGANMGPTWDRQDPGGPHGGPMNFVIWVYLTRTRYSHFTACEHKLHV